MSINNNHKINPFKNIKKLIIESHINTTSSIKAINKAQNHVTVSKPKPHMDALAR